jgi:hypothetical protein
VRLGFPNLLEANPVTYNGQPKGDPIYSARIVIHKDQAETVELIKRMMDEIAREAWKDAPAPSEFHWALQWGPQAYPGDKNVEDCWVMNANARLNSPPEVVKPSNQPGVFLALDPHNPADRNLVFSGMEAYVSIGLFAYQSTAREGGIGCGLNAVLCTGRDVGRFDSRVSANTAFANVAGELAAHPAGPTPQGFGAPQQGFGPPQQGPQPGYGAPQQGPQPGYGAPQQGPQPGYGAPQQGPQPGYGAPQQGFGPPAGQGMPAQQMPQQGPQPGQQGQPAQTFGLPPWQ